MGKRENYYYFYFFKLLQPEVSSCLKHSAKSVKEVELVSKVKVIL